MKWLKQLSNAIDYIEDNLESDISYSEVAKIASCSTYYFQRIFSYVVGISLSEYIRRRRMTKAAFELQTSDKKVMDIGTKYGYIYPTSFNRAFQSVHGVSPTVSRNKGVVLNSYPPISFSISVMGGEGMKYRLETKEAIRIVGVRKKLQENVEENFKIIPDFWDKTLQGDVFKDIYSMVNQSPNGILGVSVYENPDNIFYYIAASSDKSIVNNNLCEYKIPAATWVIFECNGLFPESIQTTFKRFFTEWLPFSGYEHALLPDIEVYPISNQKLKGGHSEVWIAVKNKEI